MNHIKGGAVRLINADFVNTASDWTYGGFAPIKTRTIICAERGMNQQSKASLNSHLNSLDGLRGIAAMLVVISHYVIETRYSIPLGAKIGSIGVMLFFSLSGFLMMHVTIGKPFDRTNVVTFWYRRFFRVVPLFLSAIIILTLYQFIARYIGVSPVYLIFNQFTDLTVVLQNITLLRGDIIFWTIGPELLFYLLFPIFWYAKSKSTVQLIFVMCVVFMVQRLSGFWVNWDINLTRLNIVIQFFMIGSLAYCGWASSSWQNVDSKISNCLFVIVVCVFTIVCPGINELLYGVDILPSGFYDLYVHQPVLWIVIPAVVFAVASSPIASKIIGSNSLRFLGTISYSTYIWHYLVIKAAMVFRPHSTFSWFAVFLLLVIPGVIAVSYLSYRYIERPLRLRRSYDAVKVVSASR
ncbi:acyltransferase family protein [Brucella anthropi]|uniref:acyltransferase family protein n=1 Tax=Brucella anthropi TaxID=529 RepID=UPI0007752622|nr:acyltransferase [Brucella anthropi]KXO76683.1 hypothetical protein AYJ56_08630 [Brucella anthropi]